MPLDLRIHGGLAVTPAGRLEADVLVQGGRIAGLIARDAGGIDALETVDARGKIILPGMVDVHVHAREPGYTHKEDIHGAGRQAAAGGVTTFFGMPNVKPPTTSVDTLREVLDLYRAKAIVDWNHCPAPVQRGEISALAQAGIRAFKLYMVVDTARDYPHPPSTGMHLHGELLAAMDAIAATGLPLAVHPHDQSLMDYVEGQYLARGENTPSGYALALAERDGVIWDTAVGTLIRLAEASGARLHISHLHTRQALDAVRRAKARGLPITAEVNHWALFLGRWEDVLRWGPYALSYWVTDDGRAAVWQAIADGTVDVVASGHAPHTHEEKDTGWTRMWSAPTGTPGLQYTYPLLLDAATRGLLSLERAVDLAATAPARVFGLAGRKGVIQPGAHADLVVADLHAPWVIRDTGVLSRCGWTPYDGRECGVRVERTYVRGRAVYRDGQVTGQPGWGQRA